MKNHNRIVFYILAMAFFIGIVAFGLDSMKGKDSKQESTVTPSAAPNGTTAAPTKKGTPSPTAVPTGTPSPTAVATSTPSPEPTATPTPTILPDKNEDGTLTAEGAIRKLTGISADLLGLEEDISAYGIEADDWRTMVEAKDCFCINVLTKDGYMAGIFYVATDGSRVYRVDEEGTFIRIE